MKSIELPEGVYGFKPDDIAKEVREMWGIKGGPIKNLFQVIENNRIPILPLDLSKVEGLESDKFSACAFTIKENLPLIVYNKVHSHDRNRFSVAHELGHIFYHHYSYFLEKADDEITFEERKKMREKEANLFAAEFLMPAEEIKEELKELHSFDLIDLKKKWKVSMAAIIERARTLGTITYEGYLQLRKYLSYRGWLIEEPYPVEDETPTYISRLISSYINQFGITVNALAKKLGLKLDEFTRIYPVKLEVQAM